MKIKKTLRWYQKEALDSLWKYLQNNWGKNPIVVLPTGSGKSLLQAEIVKKVYFAKNKTRILLLTHQKELIQQNFNELIENLDVPLDAGIYCAGLNKKEFNNRIIFASIQSCYKKSEFLGNFDIVLVDECHRIQSKQTGMYRKFLKNIKEKNENCYVVGLSATPYRMKSGLLCEGEDKLFDDITYIAKIKPLIEEGFLCNIISKNSINHIETKNIKITAGDFNKKDMEKAFNIDSKIQKAVNEILLLTQDRKKVLIFTSGIEHCENVYECIKDHNAKYVHSKINDEENKKNIKDFRDGKIKYLANVDILTTGFDVPDIDCIVLLRSTMSPGLYYQMIGRGLRISENKKNCLILDYGENILRHGPIDCIEIKKNKKTGKNELWTPPMKECPECQAALFVQTKICPECKYEYKQKTEHKHKTIASNADVLKKYKEPEWHKIRNVKYFEHRKKGKPNSISIRVEYEINLFNTYREWVCVEHTGYARKKAVEWMLQRVKNHINIHEIKTVNHFLSLKNNFKQPYAILVDTNSKYPVIKGYKF